MPETSYSFSGYGYIGDANIQKIYLRLAWYDSADCSGSQLSTTDSNAIITTGCYQPLTATAKIAPTSASCVRICASLDPVSSTTVTAYFDDLSLSVDAKPTPTPIPPAEKLLISEVLYDGTETDEGDEFIEITNPLTHAVDDAHTQHVHSARVHHRPGSRRAANAAQRVRAIFLTKRSCP